MCRYFVIQAEEGIRDECVTGVKTGARPIYSPYECGIPAAPYHWSQIQIRYYVFAIIFIIFDVEAVFLFPWALNFVEAVPIVFYEMLIFIAVLFFGVIYGWRKGVLQWR